MAQSHSPARAVRLFEVGPRDGLQNARQILSVEQKIELIERLVAAGLRDVEIGSFVHPRWVPQMSGTDEVATRLPRREGVRYWALVPNERGLERAVAAGVRHLCLLNSASESHAGSNLNRTVAAGQRINAELARQARADGAVLRGYVSTAFGCPFEGSVDFDRVLAVTESFLEQGVDEVSLGDTIGAAHPLQVREKARRVLERFGPERIAFHFHETRGLALANAFAALEEGAGVLDGSVGGVGGCPYAPGASGNVATEDLVHLLDGMNIDSRVSADELVTTTRWLDETLGVRPASSYYAWRRGAAATG
jgi:hydroxymethylglutaryl-CoA lyase